MTVVFLIALLSGAAQSANPSIIDAESTAPEEVAQAIESIVFAWAVNWNDSDWLRIETMWDPDEEAPYYLGEERDYWLIGKEGVKSYFNPPAFIRSLMESVYVLPYRLRVRLVSDNIAIAIWENRLDLKVRGRPAVNDNYRVNAVFRKKPDGWKFIHYAEAPMAPLTYLEHLYRKTVTPDYQRIAKPFEQSDYEKTLVAPGENLAEPYTPED
ncbi:MAG: hypothetical protein JSV45_13950 [Chromatiales bacterium]|nr:MAG: hypothetical protein JSV45_13950 [Chromatiales bacterium]